MFLMIKPLFVFCRNDIDKISPETNRDLIFFPDIMQPKLRTLKIIIAENSKQDLRFETQLKSEIKNIEMIGEKLEEK